MSFEQVIKAKLAGIPFSEKEHRSVLKVVLGEIQRIPTTMKTTDEACYKVVKDMIKANETVMGHFEKGTYRYEELEHENLVLRPLLPPYLIESQIRAILVLVEADVKAAKNEGQAVGVAMRALKAVNALVEGDTVKKVVGSMRTV